MALADVAPEGVDAFPEPGTRGDAGCALVHVWMHGRKGGGHTHKLSDRSRNAFTVHTVEEEEEEIMKMALFGRAHALCIQTLRQNEKQEG